MHDEKSQLVAVATLLETWDSHTNNYREDCFFFFLILILSRVCACSYASTHLICSQFLSLALCEKQAEL